MGLARTFYHPQEANPVVSRVTARTSLVESGQLTIGSIVLLVTYAQQLIGVVLLLIAVFYLSKMKVGRSPGPSLNSN